MAGHNRGERGEYEVVSTEDDDILQRKKALAPGASLEHISTSPIPPVLSYCVASIMMTVVNKYVVSGRNFSMNFLLLCIQSSVCVASVWSSKKAGLITFREFDMGDAKAWFPISFLLVLVIYSGSKSLATDDGILQQYLSIPVYTIFKNLTIILIAYGEVLWFGGRVTALTLVSFILMVISSIIAAWSDITHALSAYNVWSNATVPVLHGAPTVVGHLNSGYLWMLTNCLVTAGYVLAMRKRIKVTGFKDWDTMFYNNLLSIPVLAVFSLMVEDWSSEGITQNFPPETREVLLFAIAFSGAAAVFISYTTAWCVRTTSSTTYSMVGALNKLPVAASGMIFFGDPVTAGSVSAISTGFFAGIVYAIAKNNQSKAEKARNSIETIIPLHARKG
ncbi:UDP-galactose transporter [Hysterangium stoloniferum]|nr:UDP-galactose transporter [Hysterangium stoloniferum]